MEVSGQLTPWPLHFWVKSPTYPFDWGLISGPTCTLWRTRVSWFPCLELFLLCDSFVLFSWTMLRCWPLWCTGMGNVSEQLPDLCNCCLLLWDAAPVNVWFINSAICLLFNNAFSTARVTWRRLTGCMCIANGKRRGVLQGIVPAVAGRYWGKLNPSHNGRFENRDSHLGAFEYEAGHGICTF